MNKLKLTERLTQWKRFFKAAADLRQPFWIPCSRVHRSVLSCLRQEVIVCESKRTNIPEDPGSVCPLHTQRAEVDIYCLRRRQFFFWLASGKKNSWRKKKHPSSRLHYSKWKSLKIHFFKQTSQLCWTDLCRNLQKGGTKKQEEPKCSSWLLVRSRKFNSRKLSST